MRWVQLDARQPSRRGRIDLDAARWTSSALRNHARRRFLLLSAPPLKPFFGLCVLPLQRQGAGILRGV